MMGVLLVGLGSVLLWAVGLQWKLAYVLNAMAVMLLGSAGNVAGIVYPCRFDEAHAWLV